MLRMRPYRRFTRLLVFVALALANIQSAPDAHAQTGASLARGWQHVPVTALRIPIRDPVQLVAGSPGLVVFSFGERADSNSKGMPSGLWGSADGRTWQAVHVPAFQPDEQPMAFYAAGQLFIITSFTRNRGFIWASHDGGATWQTSSAPLDITALAAGGDGVVAFSPIGIGQSRRTTVWTSADGLIWRPLPQEAGVFASAEVMSVTKGVHGLVAAGETQGRAAIWTSSDGRTWTLVPDENGIFGQGNFGWFIGQVVAGPQGILAIGQRPVAGGAEQVLWVSVDGVHWRRERAPFAEPEGNLGQLLGGPLVAWQGGFVTFTVEARLNGAATFAGGETAVWSSDDGLTWTRLGSDEIFGGSASIAGATAFRGGVVALGSFALHPQPACLKTTDSALNDLRTFHPTVFLWSPAASVSARPPAIDRSDPRAFRLLPSDFPVAIQNNAAMNGGGFFGAYVSLCGVVPALGRHRAYSLYFPPLPPEAFAGMALDIVAQSPRAAMTGFRVVERLFALGLGSVQRKRELPSRPHIGEQTRVFRIQVQTEADGADYTFTQFVVAWRQGRAIDLVEAGTQPEAIQLAERQFAHLKHS